MDVSLLIRLIDQASAPAKKIAEGLRGIAGAAGELRQGFGEAIRQGFSVDNIEEATRNAEAALGRARGRLLGAVGMAMSVAAPVFKAGQFDQSMRGLDKVLDVGKARLADLRKFALDTSAIVPIAARELVDLMAEAAQGGVPEASLEAFSLYVARAAVAFDMAGALIGERFAKLRNVYRLDQAGIEDLGDATNHLSNNMAAKASELTDFTNRAAGAAAILKLSATQITAVGAAMIAAGIVPETAARGLTAMSTRILEGGQAIDAAFKSIGLDREAFLKTLGEDAPRALETLFAAMAKSENGMQALIDIVGGDFADDFAKFLQNPELLAQAFDLVADKADYAGSATQEAAKQAEGAARRWDLLVNKLTRLAIIVGDRLLPPLLDLTDRLGDIIDRAAAWADANPELSAAIIKTVAAILAFNIALRGVQMVTSGARLALLGLARTFLTFNGSGRNIALGWSILAGAGRLLSVAFWGIQAAMAGMAALFASITAPVWALIAALIAAGFALWKYWDAVSSFVSGFAAAFGAPLAAAVDGAVELFDTLIGKLAELFGIDAGRAEAFKAALRSMFDFSGLVDGAKAALSAFWDWLGGVFSREHLSDGERAEMYAAGQALGQSLIDGIAAMVEAHITPIRELFRFAVEIDWPEPPAWLAWLVEKAGTLGRSVQNSDSLRSGRQGAGGLIRDLTGDGATLPALPPPTGGSFGQFLDGMDRAAGRAGASLEGAAKAVADGGRESGDAVADGGARAAQALVAAGNSVAAAIKGAAAAAARANAAPGLAGSGRASALHDGVD